MVGMRRHAVSRDEVVGRIIRHLDAFDDSAILQLEAYLARQVLLSQVLPGAIPASSPSAGPLLRLVGEAADRPAACGDRPDPPRVDAFRQRAD